MYVIRCNLSVYLAFSSKMPMSSAGEERFRPNATESGARYALRTIRRVALTVDAICFLKNPMQFVSFLFGLDLTVEVASFFGVFLDFSGEMPITHAGEEGFMFSRCNFGGFLDISGEMPMTPVGEEGSGQTPPNSALDMPHERCFVWRFQFLLFLSFKITFTDNTVLVHCFCEALPLP